MPLIHIALMTSVYVTVLISLERYVRICYLCQLKESSLVTEDNIKYYIVVALVLPAIFYFPKFFEFQWQTVQVDVRIEKTVDCAEVGGERCFPRLKRNLYFLLGGGGVCEI
jgi:hypothetical protein